MKTKKPAAKTAAHTPGVKNKLTSCRYHVYKVWSEKSKCLICSYDTRNEAKRLVDILLLSERRKDWEPIIFTEIVI